MILRRLPTISSWLMAAAVWGLVPFLRPPFLVIALLVLGLRLSLILNRSPRYELVVATINTTALPFVASSIWTAAPLASLLVIAGLPWLAATLRRVGTSAEEINRFPSLPRSPVRLPGGRWASPILLALTAGLLVQALVGIVTLQPVLLGSTLTLLGGLGVLVVVTYTRIPTRFLTVQTPSGRVLAEDTLDVVVTVSSMAHAPIRIFLEEPDSWTKISPRGGVVDSKDLHLHVTLTPPLAGPSLVSSTATAVDPWGLTVLRQDVDLVHLRVIPRAAYAAWLARRCLDVMRSGALTPVTVSQTVRTSNLRRGLDYYGAHEYRPGDMLRDIFWKHTVKLQQLIVKDRRDEYGEVVLIAANLSARTSAEADWLAYNLLVSALTLAGEGVPLAYAAYTETEVVAATPPLAPRRAIMQALSFIEHIQIAPGFLRVLQTSTSAQLRRKISRLAEVETEPARRLARLLSVEYQALQHRARTHPASTALRRATSQISPPAAIVLVSAQDEADALEVTLEPLKERGFHLMHSPFADRQVLDRNLVASQGVRALGRAN